MTKKEKPLKPAKVNGRPTLYTEELAKEICEEFATHPVGIKQLCRDFPHFPSFDTISKWRFRYESFSRHYDLAKQHQLDLIAEDIRSIVREDCSFVDAQGVRKIDSGAVAQAKLIADCDKWTLSKLAPKKYGDRAMVEELKDVGEDIKAEIRKTRAGLDKKSKKEY